MVTMVGVTDLCCYELIAAGLPVLSTGGAVHYSVEELVMEVQQDYLSCLLVELSTTWWRSW